MRLTYKMLSTIASASLLLPLGLMTEVAAQDIINAGDPIVVSTMNDPEGDILGNMMVLALKDAGFEVTDNVYGFQGTANGRTALLEDETDIYMDYTGRGVSLIEDVNMDDFRDLEKAFQTIKAWDEENNELIWLTYAPFNNTNAVAVTRAFADEHGLDTMSDFAEFVNNGGEVNMLAYDYWITLGTGLPGLQETYGFTVPEDSITIQTENIEQLLGENSAYNVGSIYSTSGLIPVFDLEVLDDTEHVAPVYSPAPIIRKEVIEKYPEIEEVLDKVFKSIDSEDKMIEMNAQLQADGLSGEEIARNYLIENGLITE